MTIAAIDFARLYRDHLAAAARRPRPAAAWDARAADMNHGMWRSRYADEFIGRMDLAGARTLLDVGCGPGTICLALAGRFERVIGLDYSRGMLDALEENAASHGIGNLEAIHRAWEDDWSDVPEADIVVASRSTTVEDLAGMLARVHAKARLRVYLTHLVGGRFIAPEVAAVLGRRQVPLPDYIYVVNLLHRMGIHPRLDYIRQDERRAAADFDDFARRVAWSLGPLDEDEHERLRAWHARLPAGANPFGTPMRWAFISWDKRETESGGCAGAGSAAFFTST